jgi:hypothetical protein
LKSAAVETERKVRIVAFPQVTERNEGVITISNHSAVLRAAMGGKKATGAAAEATEQVIHMGL